MPPKSELLAEFIGIMMGDGGMSKYQAVITLHRLDDVEYARYVSGIIQKLFAVVPGIQYTKDKLALRIVLSRKNIVSFLQKCGLPVGDKLRHGLDIPFWIKRNRTYRVACVRGLTDTDGSVFTHSYISKGKRYSYKKLGFTSASPALISSVAKIYSECGLRPRVSKNGKDVRIDSITDMKRFFSTIGTHNPKHLRRYRS